ncbi:hypothetical protein ACOMHN_025752 [Nucella lapillus]
MVIFFNAKSSTPAVMAVAALSAAAVVAAAATVPPPPPPPDNLVTLNGTVGPSDHSGQGETDNWTLPWTTPSFNSSGMPGGSEFPGSTVSTPDDGTARSAKDWDDATWILTSSFIIFTMQSGFGMLESGCVSHKNEVNIMMKNVADVIFGGISYWMLGYGFSFGNGTGTNGFCGLGKFFLDPTDDASMGAEYSRFVFQASFATTATTIVSGAIAERARFTSYLIFSFFNTFIYCFPAHWVWAETGWLKVLGVVDVAGDGPVHVVGGVSALIAAIVMKPRKGHFTEGNHHNMESPIGAILGLFILWWSWLAFNCGSTYGISGGKWKIASRAATNTLMAANSGGIVAFVSSYVFHRKFLVRYVINGILSALVSITACCAVTSVKESLIIGGVGAMLTLIMDKVMDVVKIDDPVSAFAVHGVGGLWGLLATGLFAHRDTVALTFNDRDGLVRGGGFYLLGVQILEMVTITGWTLVTSFSLFKFIDLLVGLRLNPEEEEVGADFIEHNVTHGHFPTLPKPSGRGGLSPILRGAHVNPAYDMEDEIDVDGPITLCGMAQHRRSIFSITTTPNTNGVLKTYPQRDEEDVCTQNGHVCTGGINGNCSATTVHSRRGSHCSSRSAYENLQDEESAVESLEKVRPHPNRRRSSSVEQPGHFPTNKKSSKESDSRRRSVDRAKPQAQKDRRTSVDTVHKSQTDRRDSVAKEKEREREHVDEIPLCASSQCSDSSTCNGGNKGEICVKL